MIPFFWSYLPLFLLLLGLSIFVYRKSRSNAINIFFALFIFFISIWVFTLFFADSSSVYSVALFWTRAASVGPTLGLLFLSLFSFVFPFKSRIYNPYIAAFLVALSLPVVLLFNTQYNVESVVLHTWGTEPVVGFLYTYLGIVILAYLLIAFINLFTKYKFSNGIQKQQIKYTLLGAALTVMIGAFTNLILVVIGVAQYSIFGPASTLFVIGFTTFTIVRYRFLDIRVLLTRSIIFTLLAVFVSSLLIISTQLTGIYLAGSSSVLSENVLLFIAAILIILLIDPLQKLLARLTNRIFFKAAIDYQKVARDLTNIVNEEIELHSLVTRFNLEITKDLRLHDSLLYLPYGKNMFSVPDELRGDNSVIHTDSMTADSPLVAYLIERNDITILDELDRFVSDAKTDEDRSHFSAIRDQLESMKAYAAVPIAAKHEVSGLLFLSRKKSGDAFSNDDVQLLKVIAPQMASAIQKAQLYLEVKEFNIKLKQEVDNATADLRTANERLRELDQAKSEFMSIASHQLRTPLAGIMGYVSMIVDGDYGEMQKEQAPILKDILEATKRLTRLVNTFLNATRIEAGRLRIDHLKVPFHEVIEGMYKELKPTADQREVELVNASPELPEVEVDVDKIKDVLLNLIDNAIKYSPNGTVTIDAEMTGAGKHVHVMVRDTGVGIPPAEAKNLFSKFVRGSGIAQVEPNGSGLGLFIAKKIVEAHGGRIWAESEGEGKGSVFQFELPVKAKKVQTSSNANTVQKSKASTPYAIPSKNMKSAAELEDIAMDKATIKEEALDVDLSTDTPTQAIEHHEAETVATKKKPATKKKSKSSAKKNSTTTKIAAVATKKKTTSKRRSAAKKTAKKKV